MRSIRVLRCLYSARKLLSQTKGQAVRHSRTRSTSKWVIWDNLKPGFYIVQVLRERPYFCTRREQQQQPDPHHRKLDFWNCSVGSSCDENPFALTD